MINYYQIKSPLSQVTDKNITSYIDVISKELGEDLNSVSLEEYLQDDFALLYVASGGSEGYFLDIYNHLKNKKCYILTSGESNSLAASMEILSYINNHGGFGKILHGDVKSISLEICSLRNAHRAVKMLNGKKLGCIGLPSSWLIASDYSPEIVKKKLNIDFVQIQMEELLSEIDKKTYVENEYTKLFKSTSFEQNEIEKALYIYGAFKRIVDKYDLYGITVRCFDLLDTVHSTGCLGLSILNSLGIYGGCEGDMPSLLSMAIMGSVTGENLFMCNPNQFDTKEGHATFAHCTLPVTMPDRFCLNTHFESGIGVAVQGGFDEGDCTLFKCSGDLSRYFVKESCIKPTPFSNMLCRTQVRISIDDFSYFLTNPIGNHHIICKGNHSSEIDAFFNLIN